MLSARLDCSQVLNAGLDAMVSDVDVVWMQPPWPLVRYGDASQPRVRPNAALLALADVILSVDQAPRSRRDPGWRYQACRRYRLGCISS